MLYTSVAVVGCSFIAHSFHFHTASAYFRFRLSLAAAGQWPIFIYERWPRGSQRRFRAEGWWASHYYMLAAIWAIAARAEVSASHTLLPAPQAFNVYISKRKCRKCLFCRAPACFHAAYAMPTRGLTHAATHVLAIAFRPRVQRSILIAWWGLIWLQEIATAVIRIRAIGILQRYLGCALITALSITPLYHTRPISPFRIEVNIERDIGYATQAHGKRRLPPQQALQVLIGVHALRALIVPIAWPQALA